MIARELLDRLPDPARRRLMLISGLGSSADDSARAAQDRLNKIRDDGDPNAERLRRIIDDAERRRATLFELTAAIQRWLRSLPEHAVFQMVEAEPPERLEGENAERAVIRLRAKIAALTMERHRVRGAREPKDALKAQLRASVAKLAQASGPTLSLERGRCEPVFGPRDGGFQATTLWVAGLICWLDGDRVVAKLEEMVDQLPDDGLTMTGADQAARLVELDTSIEAAERAEESLISSVYNSAHVDILRRANADPACVLGVRVTAPAAIERPARRPRPAPIAQPADAAE